MFKGLSEGALEEIVFIEVKVGKQVHCRKREAGRENCRFQKD